MRLLDTFEDFAETIIFRLSPVIGGRSEVLSTSFYELLKHLKLLEEKEDAERVDTFLLHFHANPMVDEKARKRYLNSIKPQQVRAKEQPLETDLTQLEQLKSLQAHRANRMNKGG